MESLLLNDFQIDEEELRKATIYQQRNGGKLEQILVRMGALSSEQLPHIYSKTFGLELIPSNKKISADIEGLSASVRDELLEHDLLPFSFSEETQTLTVLTRDPTNIAANEYLMGLPYSTSLKLCLEDMYDRLYANRTLWRPDSAASTSGKRESAQ